MSVRVVIVEIRSLPTIVYLSRGHMFQFSGSRDKQHITQFAHNSLNRHTAQQQPGGGEAGVGADEDGSWQTAGSSADGGREVPSPLSSWSVYGDAALRWSGQLHHTITTLPAVAAALISLGVLLGVLVTMLAFALMLPNQPAPAAAARQVTVNSATATTQANGASKARKAD